MVTEFLMPQAGYGVLNRFVNEVFAKGRPEAPAETGGALAGLTALPAVKSWQIEHEIAVASPLNPSVLVLSKQSEPPEPLA